MITLGYLLNLRPPELHEAIPPKEQQQQNHLLINDQCRAHADPHRSWTPVVDKGILLCSHGTFPVPIWSYGCLQPQNVALADLNS